MSSSSDREAQTAKTPQARLYLDAVDALNKRDWAMALALARSLVSASPGLAQLHHLVAASALPLGLGEEALRHAREASRLAPGDPRYRLQLAQNIAHFRSPQNALPYAKSAEEVAWGDPASCHALSILYARANSYHDALRLSERAAISMQDNVAYLFNHATTLVFAGRMVDAGTAYEKVLALEPLHGQAHLGLAQLWCQVPGRNHVARLQAALSRVPPGMQRAYLHLALSKELEDLGDYHRSFEHLLAGKTEAKAILAYDPKRDAALFEALIDGMSHDSAVDACCESAEPIFVMGMPRTGTTLVDRILSSHPDVQSAGELLNFGVALKRATGSASPALLDAETVCRGRHVDWKRLGEDYLDSTRPLTGAQLHFVDKQPHNFLYASMIAKALPNARIVCLRRNPLDTCLSNFRQLFSVASTYHGYSFDLLDIGRYYLQFDRLISSLEAHFPGRVLQVDYEELVLNQESQTRKLLAFCGLPWSASCLSFEENLAPVATASVVQVRSKLYDRAIHRWQRYATQLQPVVDLLGRAGVDTRQMAH